MNGFYSDGSLDVIKFSAWLKDADVERVREAAHILIEEMKFRDLRASIFLVLGFLSASGQEIGD